MSHEHSVLVNFDPNVDELAALKVAIDSILSNHRVDDLVELMTANHEIGGLEGDPGWIVERKDTGDHHPYYEQWPEWASYRAFVDPSVYRIKHPECYLEAVTFLKVAKMFLRAYAIAYPIKKDATETVIAKFIDGVAGLA